MTGDGTRRHAYGRDLLLSLYSSSLLPDCDVIRRVDGLGLCNGPHRSRYTRHSEAQPRPYRGRRAGRSAQARRPLLQPMPNGAYMLASRQRHLSVPRRINDRRQLIEISCSPADRRCNFSCLNIQSVNNKVDEVIELQRDHNSDADATTSIAVDGHTSHFTVLSALSVIQVLIDIYDHSLWAPSTVLGPWAPRHCRGCRWLVTPLIGLNLH
jgi:hypothetical protein